LNVVLNLQAVGASESADDVRSAGPVSTISTSLCVLSLVSVVLCTW
jgi:hypothetical protein